MRPFWCRRKKLIVLYRFETSEGLLTWGWESRKGEVPHLPVVKTSISSHAQKQNSQISYQNFCVLRFICFWCPECVEARIDRRFNSSNCCFISKIL